MSAPPLGAGAGEPSRVYDAPDKGLLWGWEVSAYVWTKAVAAGAFLVPLLGIWLTNLLKLDTGFLEPVGYLVIGAVLALVFLVLTTVLLVKDLDQPKRFAYVLFRPQWKSWLVKGGYALTVYGGLLSLLIGISLSGWTMPTLLGSILVGLTVFAAIITAVYTAYLFAQAKGRDFWQSPVLAIHMLLHSFMAGGALFCLFAGMETPSSGWLTFLKGLMGVCLVLNLLTLLAELSTTHMTQDAKLTAQMIIKGRYSKLFWWGVIVAGNLVPLAAIWSGQNWGLMLAGALVLAGIYVHEKIWVEAPQRIPLS